MLFKSALLTTIAAALVAASAAAALADDTGFASMHDLRREKGRTCMSDHWHYGSGSGATKAAAQRDAISSWQSFTALEYGSDWASFARASGKRMSCSPSGGGVDCQIEARPCR